MTQRLMVICVGAPFFFTWPLPKQSPHDTWMPFGTFSQYIHANTPVGWRPGQMNGSSRGTKPEP